jgi:2-C-methyl-D-erythritol 4-phosphate cytidylyltransferase
MNKILAIIPSAGTGERFAENMPKQYLDLDGKSVIEHSVQPFLDSNIISKIIIPIAPNDEYIKKQSFYGSSKIVLINGGRTRSESVLNGLNHPEAKDFNLVITHDAARPNVNEDDLSNIINEITSSKADCSIFYLPVVDSIKKNI